MISSFYFVLWIAAYLLIGISGIAVLQHYAFFAAFAVVILLSRGVSSLWREPIEMRTRRDINGLLEIYYTGDFSRLCDMRRRQLWLSAASFIYMTVATVCIALAGQWIIAAIFAFFAYQTGVQTHRANAAYRSLLQAGSIPPLEGNMAEAYRRFAEVRSYRSFSELLPPPSRGEKALRIFNFVMAGLCTLIGLGFLLFFGWIVLHYGSSDTGAVINAMYGALALLYGVTDLITLIRGFNYHTPI